MPGILHETAVSQALALLGPGADIKGMRGQIRDWMLRASLMELNAHRHVECTQDRPCAVIDDGLFCKPCIKRIVADEVREWPIVIPDAFRVHRNDPRCNHGEGLFVIDAIEVDGGHVLRQKIDAWMAFADAIDFSDHAFLRLRIFSEHFVQIGEYVEGDLFLMSITDTLKKAPRGRPDPGWVEVVNAVREDMAHG